MALIVLSDATYTDIASLDLKTTVPVLPTGATEAHGPHLPLATDVIIAEAMIKGAVEPLESAGFDVLMLPAIAYTAAPFADAFSGTVSVSPESVTSLILDISRSLAHQGFSRIAVANGHLDPAHIGSIKAARERAPIDVVFPDITRKPWATRLTDEFKSGACHAGQYEGSIILAERPELVRDAIRRELPSNPNSLSVAIREGMTSFEEAGGPNAYFGHPALASADEGMRTRRILGNILADAILESSFV